MFFMHLHLPSHEEAVMPITNAVNVYSDMLSKGHLGSSGVSI